MMLAFLHHKVRCMFPTPDQYDAAGLMVCDLEGQVIKGIAAPSQAS